ncbi:MAG: metallophosphoesterase [Bacteroidetes bacterium]|nr:MAG: metallophosphoesterase [Bacteroidota bacterium]
MKLGIISDTHGLLRPGAVAALQGVDYILHSGDLGHISILHELEKIAQVIAIRGNVDRSEALMQLPATAIAELEGTIFYLVHAREWLDLDPVSAGIQVVIYGHSHQPFSETRDGVLYLNPGSAGPRRFHLPISLAILHIEGGEKRIEWVYLEE